MRLTWKTYTTAAECTETNDLTPTEATLSFLFKAFSLVILLGILKDPKYLRITDFLTWSQVPSTGFGPETMIPPKLLVYRRTHSDVNLQTLQETWRRKKSCGDLFQNGYRVRQGHHGQEKKGSQTGLYYSVWSCLHILSNWGKSLRLSVIREIASSESLMCLWQPYICGVWL